MAKRLPEEKGCFLQAESELAAINMVMGAYAAGKRAMTCTSGCGFSLMQETISYMAADFCPAVIVNVMNATKLLVEINTLFLVSQESL